ncbi:MAG: WG repeat-containing protein, partial [Stenotrophomonas sp.]|nr:WG repeat-containing protein [Stenotrophomonas sp.]
MIVRQARPAPARGRFARSLALLGALASSSALAQAPACKLLTDEHGLWPLPNCEVVDHRPKISADTLKDLNYDDHGLAVVYADQGFHYVDRKGRSLPVLTWDNG